LTPPGHAVLNGHPVDSWADDYKPGSKQQFPVLQVNGLDRDWKVLQGDQLVQKMNRPGTSWR
jgi:hypothetical protein